MIITPVKRGRRKHFAARELVTAIGVQAGLCLDDHLAEDTLDARGAPEADADLEQARHLVLVAEILHRCIHRTAKIRS